MKVLCKEKVFVVNVLGKRYFHSSPSSLSSSLIDTICLEQGMYLTILLLEHIHIGDQKPVTTFIKW